MESGLVESKLGKATWQLSSACLIAVPVGRALHSQTLIFKDTVRIYPLSHSPHPDPEGPNLTQLEIDPGLFTHFFLFQTSILFVETSHLHVVSPDR